MSQRFQIRKWPDRGRLTFLHDGLAAFRRRSRIAIATPETWRPSWSRFLPRYTDVGGRPARAILPSIPDHRSSIIMIGPPLLCLTRLPGRSHIFLTDQSASMRAGYILFASFQVTGLIELEPTKNASKVTLDTVDGYIQL